MKTWVKFLRDNYGSYAEWRNYSNMYGLAKKLGGSMCSLWRENPLIGGGINPADFGRVEHSTLLLTASERGKKGLAVAYIGHSQWKLSIEGSALYFETDAQNHLTVLKVETEKKFRSQGRAKALITLLIKSAKENGQTIDWGAFTPKGQKYLLPEIERLTKEKL